MGKPVKAYKLRLYPVKRQHKELNELMRHVRIVYNAAVNQRHRVYRQKLPIDTRYYSQRNALCKVRNRHPDTLGKLSSATVDMVIRKLESAWKGAFTRWRKTGKAKFPEEKKRVYSIPIPYGQGVKYTPADGQRHGRLRVRGVTGEIKVRQHRALPDLPIKQVSIRSERDGKWHVSFTYNESAEVECVRRGPPVGIDLGIKSRVAYSDGACCEDILHPPNWTKKYEEQLRVLSRTCARRKPEPFQKASGRYKKAKRQRAKLMAKIARCRADWLHNATTWLAESFEHIYCEDTPTQFMLKNKHLSKSAADASFGEFKRMLAYKCGDRVTFVDPAYTTQTCSRCGDVKPKKLSERVHKCEACGLELDRDINAARNILAMGIGVEARRKAS